MDTPGSPNYDPSNQPNSEPEPTGLEALFAVDSLPTGQLAGNRSDLGDDSLVEPDALESIQRELFDSAAEAHISGDTEVSAHLLQEAVNVDPERFRHMVGEALALDALHTKRLDAQDHPADGSDKLGEISALPTSESNRNSGAGPEKMPVDSPEQTYDPGGAEPPVFEPLPTIHRL